MLNHTFTFNGHSCDEYGIKIERFRNPNRPARKFQAASVAGRNGNLYRLENAWEEALISYEVFAGENKTGQILARWANMSTVTFSDLAYAEKPVLELIFNFPVRTPIAPNVFVFTIADENVTIHFPQPMYGGYYDYISGKLTYTHDSDGNLLSEPTVYDFTPHDVVTVTGTNTFTDAQGTSSIEILTLGYVETFERQWTNIMEWLSSADGYARLTDSYDPSHYYDAVFVDALDIANSWNQYGRAIVTFRRRPERFLNGYEVSLKSLPLATIGHIASGTTLNLRNGPGTSYPIINTLNDSDRFVLGTEQVVDSSTWVEIITLDRQKKGWANKQYVLATDQMFKLTNPTNNIAKPTINITHSGSAFTNADITINDKTLEIQAAASCYSEKIDCDNENVSGIVMSYREEALNAYTTIENADGTTSAQFLRLEPGDNYISSTLSSALNYDILIDTRFWEV